MTDERCFKDCVYVTGNARNPERSTVGNMHEIFAVELVVNIKTDVIEEASCTLFTELGRNFVRNLLIKHNLVTELGLIIEKVERYYQALPKKTLIAALKDAQNKYNIYK